MHPSVPVEPPPPTSDEILTRALRDNARRFPGHDPRDLEKILCDDAVRVDWFAGLLVDANGAASLPSPSGLPNLRLDLPLTFLQKAQRAIIEEREGRRNHPLTGGPPSPPPREPALSSVRVLKYRVAGFPDVKGVVALHVKVRVQTRRTSVTIDAFQFHWQPEGTELYYPIVKDSVSGPKHMTIQEGGDYELEFPLPQSLGTGTVVVLAHGAEFRSEPFPFGRAGSDSWIYSDRRI